jgi:PncC family amidohydrolase
LLQEAFSAMPDAARFYQGGLTAYNLAQKFKHLQVEPIHAQAVNCVSQKVAHEMAHGACRLFQSDWGIAITGYASPVPESGQQLFAYFSITYKGKIRSYGKINARPDESFRVQLHYANHVLKKLQAILK